MNYFNFNWFDRVIVQPIGVLILSKGSLNQRRVGVKHNLKRKNKITVFDILYLEDFWGDDFEILN